MSEKKYTDLELLYATTARCRCGAGLAYPMLAEDALKLSAWVCSGVLRGDADSSQHESFPFAFYKVREETSINNRGGATTRPKGTVCRTVGYATCPKCNWKWKSEPYDSCGKSHHWYSGPCPECGYAVGAAGSYSSKDGPAIEMRYKDVVIQVPHPGPVMHGDVVGAEGSANTPGAA